MGGTDLGGLDLDEDADVPMGLTLKECHHNCAKDFNCNCVSYERDRGIRMKQSFCTPDECAPSALVDTYLQEANYTTTTTAGSYNRKGAWDCASATTISTHNNQTPMECLERCSAESTCTCVKYLRFYDKVCTLQRNCPTLYTLPDTCDRSNSLDI